MRSSEPDRDTSLSMDFEETVEETVEETETVSPPTTTAPAGATKTTTTIAIPTETSAASKGVRCDLITDFFRPKTTRVGGDPEGDSVAEFQSRLVVGSSASSARVFSVVAQNVDDSQPMDEETTSVLSDIGKAAASRAPKRSLCLFAIMAFVTMLHRMRARKYDVRENMEATRMTIERIRRTSRCRACGCETCLEKLQNDDVCQCECPHEADPIAVCTVRIASILDSDYGYARSRSFREKVRTERVRSEAEGVRAEDLVGTEISAAVAVTVSDVGMVRISNKNGGGDGSSCGDGDGDDGDAGDGSIVYLGGDPYGRSDSYAWKKTPNGTFVFTGKKVCSVHLGR